MAKKGDPQDQYIEASIPLAPGVSEEEGDATVAEFVRVTSNMNDAVEANEFAADHLEKLGLTPQEVQTLFVWCETQASADSDWTVKNALLHGVLFGLQLHKDVIDQKEKV